MKKYLIVFQNLKNDTIKFIKETCPWIKDERFKYLKELFFFNFNKY
ncbi:Uncharacterised protein [Candidatus Azoamicus ciliaticola]|uniref:Uncharacterized protein n=1 Tax=Candidatus Azoamicus ciliaticola TaxID=2652803 RepID=A0A6J5JZ77_9GAMM|nr:Uncharacterised protein [Candidatus Azoamicus ciliaticola]